MAAVSATGDVVRRRLRLFTHRERGFWMGLSIHNVIPIDRPIVAT